MFDDAVFELKKWLGEARINSTSAKLLCTIGTRDELRDFANMVQMPLSSRGDPIIICEILKEFKKI